MSYYGNRTSTDKRTRTPRKDSVDSGNTNGNNNNDVSKGLGSYISNYTRRTEYSQKTSLSRKPGAAAPRTKSNLVGSMTATFEQLNKGSIPPPGNSSIKSSSYNLGENATTIDQKTTNSPKLENGTVANHTPRTTNTPKLENGTAKHDVDDEDPDRTPPARAKSSSSARRGKQQRERRMLRQKRRSTGVVRLNESDDEAEKGTEKKEGNDPNGEKDDEVTRKSETENNTLSNEFSPPPSANSIRTESGRTYEATEGTTSVLKSTLKSPTVSSLITSPQPSDNVFTSGDSTSQSPTMPVLNSSKRRGNKSSYERSQQDSNEKREIDELRGKLATAEIAISKLSKEIEDMETDTQHLVEQNHDLKKQNKMLEDENSSMLMVLKQLRNSTA